MKFFLFSSDRNSQLFATNAMNSSYLIVSEYILLVSLPIMNALIEATLETTFFFY
jgi:hypothetical protein